MAQYDIWKTTPPEPDYDPLDDLECRRHRLPLTEEFEEDDDGPRTVFVCAEGCCYPGRLSMGEWWPDGSEEEWPPGEPEPDLRRDDDW